jgi:sorbitol-specific phosphotransferase system component IIBC
MPSEHILRIASQIHDPVTVAIVAAVLLAAITYLLAKTKKNQAKVLLGILIVAYLCLASVPLLRPLF